MVEITDVHTRLAGYALVRDEQARVLLTRWVGTDRPLWSVPGGGIEWGETVEQGTVREVFEESGLHVALDGLFAVTSQDFEPDGPGGRPRRAVRVFHHAHVTGGELAVEVGGSSDAVGWFTLDEVAGLDRVSSVDEMLRAAGLLGTGELPGTGRG